MASLTSLDGKVEPGQILVCWEASRLDLVGDRPDLALGGFGFEQLGEDRNRGIKGGRSLLNKFADRLGHAIHLEGAQHDHDGGAGRIMTHGAHPFSAQRIVAFDVGPRLLGAIPEPAAHRSWRNLSRLAVNQPVQEVQDVGLRGNAGFQRHLDGAEHRLLIVLQHKGEDFHHLPVAARVLEEMTLQVPEGIRHLGEGGAIAQGARFALDDRQIVPPVVDRSTWQIM